MAATWKKLAYEADVVTKATLTAKGDIISASAASTPSVLSVGGDGTVLTADSGEASGLSWTTPVSESNVIALIIGLGG